MLTAIELLAVISGAIFGVLLARRKHMDFVGVFSVACITSFGGGTVRDILLDRHPLFWIEHAQYPIIVFVVAGIASLIPHIPAWIEKWLDVPDAFGLALFSVVGTEYALEADVSPFVAVLFGVITGTFGGVMGDIVCNEVPSLFRPATPLYATCAFIGCWILIGAQSLSLPPDTSRWVSATFIVTLRLLALRYRICLKAIESG